jgi:predicted Ser/Thr protein kinase
MDSRRAASIRPGALIAERFVLEHQLGRGSMGSVWLARHRELEMPVALKFMDAELLRSPELLARFSHEARAAAQIKSPHVIGVLDYGVEDGRPYIAMEYLEGEDLGRALERHGRLAAPVVLRVVQHAARGLARAHAAGVVHRDVKPENLFLTSDESHEFLLKILDFGVAKLSAAVRRTTYGQVLGSPVYMSPEQAKGVEIDGRSDLFSLGVVAYQCLTGHLPFEGSTFADVVAALLTARPVPPSRRVLGLPASLDAWVDKALRREPSERFQFAAEMADTLAGCFSAPARSAAPSHADVPRLPPELARPAPDAAPTDARVDATMRQLYGTSGVLAGAFTRHAGAEPELYEGGAMPDGLASRVFRSALAMLSALREQRGLDVGYVAAHFAGATLLARAVGDRCLLLLASPGANLAVLQVALHACASKLARAFGPRGAEADGPPSSEVPSWSSWAPRLPAAPCPPGTGEGGAASSGGPERRAPGPTSDALGPASGAVSARGGAPAGPAAHLINGVALALARQVGPVAHVLVKREVTRLGGVLDSLQVFLDLLDALAASLQEPARRITFLREAQALVLSEPPGTGR